MVQLAPQPQTEREARANLTLVKPSPLADERDVFVGGSGNDRVVGTIEAQDEINLNGPDAPPPSP